MRIDLKKEGATAAFIGHPYIAMSALTIELLLKTLHAMHSENPVPQIHDLGQLFRGLDASSRRIVQRAWDPVFAEWHERWDNIRKMSYGPGLPKLTPLVVEALESSAKAFELARYTFTTAAGSFDYYVDDLRKPLIGAIVKKRPEWSVWRVTSPKQTSWDELHRQVNPEEGPKPE